MANNTTVVLGLHGDPVSQIALSRLCNSYGYEVRRASNLNDLFGLVRISRPALVVMDANYGNPDSPDTTPALQVAQELRITKGKNDKGLVLAISGNNEIIENVTSLKGPCLEVMQKPIDTSYILNILDSLSTESKPN